MTLDSLKTLSIIRTRSLSTEQLAACANIPPRIMTLNGGVQKADWIPPGSWTL